MKTKKREFKTKAGISIFLLLLILGVSLFGGILRLPILSSEIGYEEIVETGPTSLNIYQWVGPRFKIYWGDKSDKSKQIVRISKEDDKYFELSYIGLENLEGLKESTEPGQLVNPQPTTNQQPTIQQPTGQPGITLQPTLSPAPTIEVGNENLSPTPTPYEQVSLLNQELKQAEESNFSKGAILSDIQKELEDIKQRTASIAAGVSEAQQQSESLSEKITGLVGDTSVVIKNETKMVQNAEFAKSTNFLSEPDLDGLRNHLIIKNNLSPSYYLFDFTGQNLSYFISNEGNLVITDNATGKKIILMGPLMTTDASGKTSTNARIKIYEGINGRRYLAIMLDDNFLKDGKTIYPVQLDIPTIIYDQQDDPVGNRTGFFKEDIKSAYAYKFSGRNFEAYFDDQVTGVHKFKFDFLSRSIELALLNSQQNIVTESMVKNTRKDGRKEGLNLKETIPKVDFTYLPKENGIKEMITLKDKNAPTTFEFLMTVSSGLQFRKEANGSIVFFTPKKADPSSIIKTNDYFTLEKPYMADNNGIESNNVIMDVIERDGMHILKVTADEKWLQETGRAYPVVIDPSIVTVGTIYSTMNSWQRHVWHDGARYWTSVANETGIKFYYSTDLSTWTENTSAAMTLTAANMKWTDTSSIDVSQETSSTYDVIGSTTYHCQSFTVNKTGVLDKVAAYTSNGATFWGYGYVGDTSSPPGILTDNGTATQARFTSNGAADYQWGYFDFRNEPILISGTTYNLCLEARAGQAPRWQKNASGVHDYRIYLRDLQTNWSIMGDNNNAYVVYHDNMDVKGRQAIGYPGTGFSWGSETMIFNGGTCGNKDQVGGTCTGTDEGDNAWYDYPVISKDSSNYLWTLARQDLFTGASTQDDTADYYNTLYNSNMTTSYTDDAVQRQIFYPNKSGVLDKVSIYIRNSYGTGHTITGKVSVTDCVTATNALTDDITSASIAGSSTVWVSLDFTKEPLLKRNNPYYICIKGDAAAGLKFLKEGTIGTNLYKIYLRSNNSQIITEKQVNAINQLPNWSNPLSTPSAIVSSSIVYGNIIPLTNQDMYAVWNKNGAIEGAVWDNSNNNFKNSSGIVDQGGNNVDTVDVNGATSISQNFSGVRDRNSNLHLGYVNSLGKLDYKKGTLNATPGIDWSTVKEMDSGTTNYYPSSTYSTANDVYYLFWSPGSTIVRYNKMTTNTNAWDSANTDILTGLNNLMYLGTDEKTSYQIIMQRQEGATPTPYNINVNSLDTGLDKLMRGGKWFENKTKQRYSF